VATTWAANQTVQIWNTTSRDTAQASLVTGRDFRRCRLRLLTTPLTAALLDHDPVAYLRARKMSFLSRSDDSDSSESSGFGSHGRQRRTSTLDSHDNRRENTPGSPPLKKLRRSDYNAFASLVNGLKQTRPTKPLNERLLVRSVTPSRPQPDVTATGRGVTPIVELPPTSRPARPGTRLKFDAQAKVDQLLDDRWPLYSQQLDPRADFAECIGTVASKLVRVRRMVNPYIWNKAHVMEETLDEGDDVFAPLPEDLVESTRMYLDKLLAGLAILRPSMTRPQRERLAPTGWRAVLETAGLVKHGSRWELSSGDHLGRKLTVVLLEARMSVF